MIPEANIHIARKDAEKAEIVQSTSMGLPLTPSVSTWLPLITVRVSNIGEKMLIRLGAIIAAGVILSGTPGIAAELNTRDITDQKEISARTDDFEKDLIQLGMPARLDCTTVIGIQDNSQGSDESFGAICDLHISGKKSSAIMLCNDTMIGKLTIKAYGFSVNKAALGEFTKSNCQPGG